MKELFTEKDYTEAVQKLNEKMINDFYNNLSNYSPFDNYVNFNNYEITKDSLLLQKKSSNTINIKFNNPYRTDKEIQKIVFSNIIINYSSQSNQTMKLELKMK